MDVGDEQVALVDERGRVIGSTSRREMRRRNLRHLATGVIVRNSFGLVYVHRRTLDKDVYPGMHDCCAGGVVAAGESPEEAARRELAEELDVSDVPLQRVLEGSYADEVTRYHANVYEAVWDGPVRHQPEEVDWGGWMTLDELAEHLADPAWPFVPDTRALVADWLAERLADRRVIPGGWDSEATLVERRWIDRTPRRPVVEARLRTETRLLPWLAARLPLAVPQPTVIWEEPLRVRHVSIPGEAASSGDAATGAAVGVFLRALHAVPVGDAVALGVPDRTAVLAEREQTLERFRRDVLGRLPHSRRASGVRLLDAAAQMPTDTLVHGDLGPEHLLVHDGVVSGVIDWSDAHIGDAALDLAWTLHGATPVFAQALAHTYRPDDAVLRRSRLWHQLGPWHEVVHGLDTGQPELVRSGLSGVLGRLGG